MKRLCIFCKHFEFNPGSPGYSEYTPGENMSMGCNMRVWEFDFGDDFHQCIQHAYTCEKYERSKDAAEMGAPE